MQCITSDQYTNFGYRAIKGFIPRNWFQFADDTAAISSLESENQLLLNVFNKWCTWSDKCHSFELCKKETMTVQYLPKLYINNFLIPPVKVDDQFTYLGRHFDFQTTDSTHKDNLLNVINDQFEIIDRLRLHQRNKLLLYQFYTLAKISWHMTVLKNNLDNIISRYVRKWLGIPAECGHSIKDKAWVRFGYISKEPCKII